MLNAGVRVCAWASSRLKVSVAILALALLVVLPGAAHAAPKPPNILFIMIDDVGIDQMRTFGYGGQTPPSTPTIEQIANAGLRFNNTWSMPACSPSRAVFFNGRFPVRTNVLGALGADDLANSQVSPFEMTAPKLLKARGYKSGLFGKYHLGLQGHNPYGDGMPSSLGWDYFFGWLDETGDPSSIDTTAGGVASDGTWSCGFVPGSGDRSPKYPEITGADTGACYAVDNTCRNVSLLAGIPPGRACRDSGGIFDPGKTCQASRPANLDFSRLSAHYVSPLVINHENGAVEAVPPTDIRARSFRGSVVVDEAIDWIRRQPAGTPWMASVTFASVHTPLMQPPPALLASGAASTSGLNCADSTAQRVLANQMLEALDTEVGRLLVATGLAQRNAQGGLDYLPGTTDTMVILVGDNGSFGSTVKAPFDPSRAKGTAYQTGVWVPLVVAGPLVAQPNRVVSHMVNIADLFQLFGEIAGIDVPATVPRPIDSSAMLPYLVNPSQASIRTWNFTQVGPNLQAGGSINGPCVFPGSCSQIPVSKSVCEDNGGVWWGRGSAVAGLPPEGLKLCCDVNVWITQHPEAGMSYASIQPLTSVAIRNSRYKIVRNSTQLNDAAYSMCVATTTDEFYEIDEAVPTPRLDLAGLDLKKQPSLTPEQQANYDALAAQLNTVLASQPACPGDGNADGKVDALDVSNWSAFSRFSKGASSWYDVNLDGFTDRNDLAIIQANLGNNCQAAAPAPPPTVAPAVTSQPANQTVTVGQLASFTSAASGSPAPTVQWQVSANGGASWNVISGATTADYAFQPSVSDSGRRFRAVFTNSAGTAASASAVLTTLPAPPAGSAFGMIDTPVQNAADLQGAVGVTGWVLDDSGIAGVKLYRNCLPFDNQAGCQTLLGYHVVFLGDAAIVPGARPDVEAAYQNYPQVNRAGWGYLVQTNTLPHVPGGQVYGGQGPLTLYAFATAADGETVLLGRAPGDSTATAITMNNDAIARPFGTIDTPRQGETISGAAFANFGWALAPDADALAGNGDVLIPSNGSSMVVFIDGLPTSPVTYNLCRGTVGNPVPAGVFCNDDVANVFGNPTPQPAFTARTSNPTRYRNLDAGRGAIGASVVDTTKYANGTHSIAWSVRDSSGVTEGIGSRDFVVLNTGSRSSRGIPGDARPEITDLRALLDAPAAARGEASDVTALRIAAGVVTGRTGYDLAAPLTTLEADADGVRHVRIRELGRLELHLGPIETGYLLAHGQLRDMPPGSHLDAESGLFTWAPLVGYVGSYRLAFVRGSEQLPFEVTVYSGSAPEGQSEIRMHVDTPADGTSVREPLTVAGWALDSRAFAGAGIGLVHVWAQRRDVPGVVPEFLGAATLALARPDVAARFGAQFGSAGFGLMTEALPPGDYAITAYAWNQRTARWEDARTVHVTVR